MRTSWAGSEWKSEAAATPLQSPNQKRGRGRR
jgi:hypothetical protein